MSRLFDSQLVVLTAACQRADRCVFPVTGRLKGNAAGNVLKSLLKKKLVDEVPAQGDDTVWRHDEQQGGTYCLTQLCSRGFLISFIKHRDAAHRGVVHSGHGDSRAARADAVEVGRRADLEAGAAVGRPHLDGVEHDAMLEPSQNGT